MILSASSKCPRPRAIEHSGEPPMPNRLAKAIMMLMIGRHRPSPVRESVAFSGSRPMYMRSMMLYRILISCASVIGTARDRILPTTLPFEKSFSGEFSFCMVYSFHLDKTGLY